MLGEEGGQEEEGTRGEQVKNDSVWLKSPHSCTKSKLQKAVWKRPQLEWSDKAYCYLNPTRDEEEEGEGERERQKKKEWKETNKY